MTGQGIHPDAFASPIAASLPASRTRTLRSGDTFGVFDAGDDVSGRTGALYFRDTRHLSRLILLIDGERPVLLSSTLRDDSAELTCDLANPDLHRDGRLALERDMLHLRRSHFLWNATCFERLSVHSFAGTAQHVRLELHFAADFTDLFESRGMTRVVRGAHLEPDCGAAGVVLAYDGLDRQHRTTRLRFDPAPAVLDGEHAVFEFDIAPGETRLAFVEIACNAEPATDIGEGGQPPRLVAVPGAEIDLVAPRGCPGRLERSPHPVAVARMDVGGQELSRSWGIWTEAI